MSETTIAEIRSKNKIVSRPPDGGQTTRENAGTASGPFIGSLRVVENAGLLKEWVEVDTIETLLRDAPEVNYRGSSPEWGR